MWHSIDTGVPFPNRADGNISFPENRMIQTREIRRCVICAWRGECQKKFFVPDGGARCPDFTRDVTVKNPDEDKVEKN
jgi:hypothetical protein